VSDEDGLLAQVTFDNSAETSGAMLGEHVDKDPLPSPEPVSHRPERGLDPPRPMIVAMTWSRSSHRLAVWTGPELAVETLAIQGGEA
jgi:hypothetical protein